MSWKDDIEQTFTTWSKRSSLNEEQKCENALRMIKDAVNSNSSLSNLDIDFLPQGSYYNNTNVRHNSDVDLCVRLKSTFFYELPEGTTIERYGITPSTYTFAQYQSAIGDALRTKFGCENVTKGNKAFDVHSNSYRVDADVVACFEHRRYLENGDYIVGTQFYSGDGFEIINFPEQHYINGVTKNTSTGRRYKRVVRILKRLRKQMESDEVEGIDNISSFLTECLVWNVPNVYFGNSTYSEDTKNVLQYLYHNTNDSSLCKEWGEVSDLLYLFHGGRNYTLKEVNSFILKAYNHVYS